MSPQPCHCEQSDRRLALKEPAFSCAFSSRSARRFLRRFHPNQHPSHKQQAAQQTNAAKNRQRGRRSEPFRESSSQQRTNRLHAHEHRRVYRHQPTTQLLRRAVLHGGVGGCHLRSRGESHHQQNNGRK